MNLWKAFALIMICLLIIVAGLRFAYVETHVFSLTEEQKAFAIKAAKDGLKDEIEGKNYNVTAVDRGRIISTANGDKKVASVIFTYTNTTLAVRVDMDTGELVEKIKVEYSGWMTEYQATKPWAHRGFFK